MILPCLYLLTYLIAVDDAALAFERPLADAEDHELRRLNRGHADFDNQAPHIARRRRVELLIAFDVEGLVGRSPEERAIAPDRAQEGIDIAADAAPEQDVVGLEDGPLRAAL